MRSKYSFSHFVLVIKYVVILTLCVLLPHSGNAQESQATKPDKYWSVSRTFFSPAEFALRTKGKVRIYRNTSATTPADGQIIGTSQGLMQRTTKGNLLPYLADLVLPSNEITAVAETPSFIWIGTKHGAIRYNYVSGAKPSYLAGKRWLPDDYVTGFGFEEPSKNAYAVWIETPKGFSRMEYKMMTLAEKSQTFVERIRARHVRHGMTSDSLLQTPGDLTTNKTVSSDNDGLWTAMYVAAECFRFKVTGDEKAREYARIGMQALLRLESITGIAGFPARSFIKKGEDIQPTDGEWHDTPDGLWRWKGDTSSDEIVGHYFIYPLYYDLVADEAEKKTLAAALDRITNHILDHDYQLIDVDGKKTRWGWWGPDAIWEDPDELGLRALHLLAHLRSAMHVTQSETNRAKYQRHYDELISKHRYHHLMRNQKINIPGKVNHSDDELAFLSYYPLLQYETDAALRKVYQESLERAWLVERPERNPLWNFIYAVGTHTKEFDGEASIRTLQEIPLDQIEWTVKNSHRNDVLMNEYADRHGRGQALIVLPYSELPMHKWNGNPYQLDGGNGGRSEDDGAYFLLPYWLGRYHKLIDE